MRGIGRYDGQLFPATSAPPSSSLLPVTDLHAQPAAPTQHRHSPLARAGLGWFVLLVVYASLYPFAGWTDTGVSPFAFLSAPLPRYNTAFDMLTNVWGYMPLGMLTVLALHPRITGWRAVLLAMLAGLLLSGAMEAIQTYLPTRVSSNVDLATNTLGALLGGLVMLPFAARLIDRGGLRRLRRRWFEPHATFAILLMLVWPFAQIFPQEFLFSMGGVIRSILLDPSPDAFVVNLLNGWFPELFDWQDKLTAHPEALQRQELLEALITACSWIGTGLLASVAMRRGAPMLRLLAALLAGALLVKAGATVLQFPLGGAWDWLSSGARFGLIVGSLVLVLLVRLPRWLRGALAMTLLIALIILSNVLPPSPYSWVSAQSWRLGRFVHFNSLSQWIGWLWPFLGLGYLAWRAEQTQLQRRAGRHAR
ncbi:teicoplanin resistance protein VanZ [Ralstonia pickettii]|uniref:Teicoplanin resistance protein VanZ n=1 Tax=Ralstonia pickettii TaxID=329 RepID=A0A7X2HKS5_RALPI|nr:VanZ family protein [Ralstonia pickettii]MRS98332.1 teicoplanin resistance protein VanZ [Ralstonia pickettii]